MSDDVQAVLQFRAAVDDLIVPICVRGETLDPQRIVDLVDEIARCAKVMRQPTLDSVLGHVQVHVAQRFVYSEQLDVAEPDVAAKRSGADRVRSLIERGQVAVQDIEP